MPVSNNKNQIVIKKSYFDNIKTAIDSMNAFFSSNFKNKDFPAIDAEFQVDGTIMNILSWLNNVEPAWIDDVSKIENVLNSLNEVTENIDGDIYEQLMNDNNKVVLDHINAFVGYKVLQFIADNFEAFGQFVNGIYTFELFTKPSKYRNVIELFSQPVPIEEIEDIMGNNTYTLFDPTKYVTGVFNNEQITMPKSLVLDNEIARFENLTDIDVEILVDESVQEAAEVNYFENVSPTHIKYDTKKNKWVISKQFEKAVNDLVAELRKCDSTEDLIGYFTNPNKSENKTIDMILETVVPCIYVRVMNNASKSHDQFNSDNLEPYMESYNSIISKNKGALRFKNYDLFSTFKADKEGTIKFLEDFLKLNLVNDEGCVIQNNTLLTLFNIFDSRIYLDILYNILPEDVKKDKYPTEDGFVKEIRARINRNSRSANVYKPDNNPSEGNDTPTSKEVVEYAVGCFAELGDMSITDMQYCEHYRDAVVSEINCLNDIMYNKGTSQIAIDNYIGESYNVFGEGFFGDMIEKYYSKKIQKNMMSEIKRIESQYNVKFSDEYVSMLNSIDTRKPAYIKPLNGLNHANNLVPYPFFLIYDFSDEKYRPLYSYLNDMEGTDTSGLYPVIRTYTCTYESINNPEKYDIIFSDTEGNIYASLFNKEHKLELVSKSLSEFISTCMERKFFFKDLKTGLNDLGETECSYDDHDNYFINIFLETYGDGSISTKCLEMIDMVESDSFGETVMSEVIPLFVDSCDRKYLEDREFDILDTISKMIIKPDGSYECYFKYNNKEISFKEAGVNLAVLYNRPTQESYVQEQEMGGIPDYMRTRIDLSDEAGTSPNVTTTDIQLPPDCPTNPIDDLAGSIDARMQAGGGLEDMLGAGYNDNPNKNHHEGKIVYNITNNYNNSFNKDSNNRTSNVTNDLSTGKTTTTSTSVSNTNSHNDSSTNKKTDNSSRKSVNKGTNGANNNNNSNGTVDTKDSSNASKDGNQTFSNGLTVQEMFAFLESEEPLSNGDGAGKPPKGDLLTAAMDVDRQTLAAQQGAKRTVQKAVNTGKAILKPVARTKQWLTKIVDSLIKRDEDRVKAEIIENPSYRTALYKAMRLALKFGLTGVCFTVSGYLGAAYLAIQGAKLADKHRLKKEVQEEFTAELEILNDKIRKADLDDTPESRKAKWQMMRLRSKMQRMAVQTTKTSVKDPRYDF